MRLSKPDLNVEHQIHQTGIGIINLFGEDLFNFIDTRLQTTDGKNWLLDLQKSNYRYQKISFKDPSNLLKDLLRESSSVFRQPIREAVAQKEAVDFYERLQVVLDERNEWVHHQVDASVENLRSLALAVSPIAKKLDLPITVELDFFLQEISMKLNECGTSLVIKDETLSEECKSEENSENIYAQELVSAPYSLGDRIDEKFLPHSYSLLTDGTIKDRKTNKALAEENTKSQTLGIELLKLKPGGGRLRITQSGLIAGYFDEFWGYISKVDAGKWFPGHF